MPGRPPLGGPVLSHDIVEAALLGRGGSAVEWDFDATGSYDRMPEDAISYGRRDRRWCQGNLQHFWLVFGGGMRFWHRFYFLNGIFSYLSGPMVVALTLVGFAQMAGNPKNSSAWSYNPKFLVVMLGVLAFPRFLGLARLALHWRIFFHKGSHVRRCAREISSTLTDMALSFVLSPMLFYMHLRAVVEILSGQTVDWQTHSRCAATLPWSAAASMFWVPTLLGIAWSAAAFAVAPGFLPYLLFLTFGWIFSIPIAVATSSPRIGNWAARLGLFEECLTEAEVAELAQCSKARTSVEPALSISVSATDSATEKTLLENQSV